MKKRNISSILYLALISYYFDYIKFLISDTYPVIVLIFLKITSLSLGSLIVCWLIEVAYCLLVTCLDVCCLTVLTYFMLLN